MLSVSLILAGALGNILDSAFYGVMFSESDEFNVCLLYTSDAADERSSVDLGGRRIIKKKNRDSI